MASDKVDLEEVQQLIKLVEDYGLKELTVSEGEFSITVRGVTEESAALVYSPPPGWQTGETGDLQQAVTARSGRRAKSIKKKEPAKPRLTLLSPMTGVFYRSPSPDAPWFVDVGDTVKAGQIIGLIEAMKVFSEVPTDISGRVVEIVPENGKLVHADEPLMFLEAVEE